MMPKLYQGKVKIIKYFTLYKLTANYLDAVVNLVVQRQRR